jgi:hypothetical protein
MHIVTGMSRRGIRIRTFPIRTIGTNIDLKFNANHQMRREPR